MKDRTNRTGRDLVTDAVRDAQALKQAFVETAKNELVEAMTPALKRLLEKNIRGESRSADDKDPSRRKSRDDGSDGDRTDSKQAKDKGDVSMDDNKQDMELDLESLAGMFPQLAEMEDDEEMAAKAPPAVEAAPPELPYDESAIPMLGEEPKMDDDDEEGPMDEEVEISEAELRKVYEAALQTEVEVKKGFGEMTKSGELDEVDPAAGIVDVKKGEHVWDKEEPPAKQDFSVKEMIQRGLAENKALRTNNRKLAEMVRKLATRLHETNLFNAKVLHVNRILNGMGRLTTEQKRVVMESIDKARSVKEVKMVYETIVGSFRAAQSLTENRSRRPGANAQRARTPGSPNQKVLRESVDRGSEDAVKSRWQQLAGLVK